MKALLLLPLLLTATAFAASSAQRPNIVFIMADDLGYGDIGPFGQKLIRTPNLDRLAAEGTCFTQYYAGGSVCSPTRSVLMTGQHTGHTRIRGNHGQTGLARVPLKASDVTVAEVMKSAGYATAIAGKWGLGEPGTEGIPNRQGFDRWFGYLNNDLAEFYYPEKIWRNEEEITLPGNIGGRRGQYSNDLMTEEALSFIDDHRARPFFLYLAYTIPHSLLEVPEDSLVEYRGKFPEPAAEATGGKNNVPEPRATFAAMVTRLDREVGRVLGRLQKHGLEKNTLVFFCSDNGAPNRAGLADYFGSTAGFRGHKGSLFEGGIRTPMIVRWPGQVPAGKRSDYAWGGWDVLPTAAALAGAVVLINRQITGLLKPLGQLESASRQLGTTLATAAGTSSGNLHFNSGLTTTAGERAGVITSRLARADGLEGLALVRRQALAEPQLRAATAGGEPVALEIRVPEGFVAPPVGAGGGS